MQGKRNQKRNLERNLFFSSCVYFRRISKMWRKNKGRRDQHCQRRLQQNEGRRGPGGAAINLLPVEMMTFIFQLVLLEGDRKSEEGKVLGVLMSLRVVCSWWNELCMDEYWPLHSLLKRKKEEDELQEGKFQLSVLVQQTAAIREVVGDGSLFFSSNERAVYCWKKEKKEKRQEEENEFEKLWEAKVITTRSFPWEAKDTLNLYYWKKEG